MKRLLNALDFAAEKHRDHRRKDAAGTPYINHPIEVAGILADIGDVQDEKILMAAVLHDTVEDTATTFDELEERFGERVREFVAEVTDDRRLTREERWQAQIDHAEDLSEAARLIKLADKISNVGSIIDSPPAKWSDQRKYDYLCFGKKVIDQIQGTNQALEDCYYALLKEAMEGLDLSNKD